MYLVGRVNNKKMSTLSELIYNFNRNPKRKTLMVVFVGFLLLFFDGGFLKLGRVIIKLIWKNYQKMETKTRGG